MLGIPASKYLRCRHREVSLLLILLQFVVRAHGFSPIITRASLSSSRVSMSSMNDNEESMEVIRSLIDFHDGSWDGKATSFSITPDVAAGIVQRKTCDYKTSIKLGLSEEGMTLTETFQFDDDKISSRNIPLIKSNLDVDSVDGSYSLDSSLASNTVPSAITGTERLTQFGIEHVIAVNDDARARCLALYSIKDASLARVVVMHEDRVKGTGVKAEKASSKEDLLASMDGDIDRIVDKIAGQVKGGSNTSLERESVSEDEERMERLQKAMQSSSSSQDEGPSLSLHPLSLLELSSGVWLGDVIIRDLGNVAATPFDSGKGFTAKPTTTQQRQDFARWDVGVQKNAWRWIWKLGESIRQEDEVGKAMGTPMATCLSESLSGTVCVNESLSRRIPKDERMVFVNWDNGDYVSFILGSVSMQLPRFLTFDSSSTKKTKPFFTEFCVYQSADAEESDDDGNDEEDVTLKELCCSKMARVYNFEGELKQGCTSFFTLRRL